MLRKKEEIKAQLELLYKLYDKFGCQENEMIKDGTRAAVVIEGVEQLVRSRIVDKYQYSEDLIEEFKSFILLEFYFLEHEITAATKILAAAPRAQRRNRISTLLNGIDDITDKLYSRFQKLEE